MISERNTTLAEYACCRVPTSVAHEGEASVLVGVEVRDVHVDEAHVGVLEGCLGGGGEVRPAGAHADNEVGLGRHAVGGEGARRAYRAQSAGVVVGHRALASLGLAYEYAGPLTKPTW